MSGKKIKFKRFSYWVIPHKMSKNFKKSWSHIINDFNQIWQSNLIHIQMEHCTLSRQKFKYFRSSEHLKNLCHRMVYMKFTIFFENYTVILIISLMYCVDK